MNFSLYILLLFLLHLLTISAVRSKREDVRTTSFTSTTVSALYSWLGGGNGSVLRHFSHFKTKEAAIDREGASHFLAFGGIILSNGNTHRLLCKIGLDKVCQSQYIADVIDLIVSFNPVYTYFQDKQPLRYRTHFNFLNYIKSFGIKVQVTEAIITSQGQTYRATNAGNEPWELQIKVSDIIYYRENLVNVAARKLRGLWEYLVMIDGHEFFTNSYWWEEGVYKGEHWTNVQLFQDGHHLNTYNDTIYQSDKPAVAYAYSYKSDLRNTAVYNGNGYILRREVYEEMNYIMDFCIGGGCDGSFFIASMEPEKIKTMLKEPIILRFGNYFRQFDEWIWNTTKVFKQENAVIRGRMLHFYHEELFDYSSLIVAANEPGAFDYKKDLYRDENFTLHLKNQTLGDLYELMCYGPDQNTLLVYNRIGDKHRHVIPIENMALWFGHYFLAFFNKLFS